MVWINPRTGQPLTPEQLARVSANAPAGGALPPYQHDTSLTDQLRQQYNIGGPMVHAGSHIFTTKGVYVVEGGKIAGGPISIDQWNEYSDAKRAGENPTIPTRYIAGPLVERLSSGSGTSGTGGTGGTSGTGGTGGTVGATPPRTTPTGTYKPSTGTASPFKPSGTFLGSSPFFDPEYPTPPGVPGVPGNPLPIPPGQQAMEFRPYGEPVGEFTQQRSYGGLPRSIGPWGESGGYYGGNPYIPDLPTVPGYTPPPTTTPPPLFPGPISGGVTVPGFSGSVIGGGYDGPDYGPNRPPNQGSVWTPDFYYPNPDNKPPPPDSDTVFPHPGPGTEQPYDPGDGPVYPNPGITIEYVPWPSGGTTTPPPSGGTPPPGGGTPPPGGGGGAKPGDPPNRLHSGGVYSDGSYEALLASMLASGAGAV